MWNYVENGSVTSVTGFKASGIFCGLKKSKKDIALIYSPEPCSAAGTFTLNKVKAAPLLVSQKMINGKNKIKAILINSGNANACTGEEGMNDALESQKYCAQKLGVATSEVLISSTGVIGQKMAMDKLLPGIDKAIEELNPEGGLNAVEAIMTTDIKKKHFALNVHLSFGNVTIGSICKGSGMIMPNMATMLAFITTDADIDQANLQTLLSYAVKNSFNKVSVDGETSTNDMVVLITNHKSKNKIEADSEDYEIFKEALLDICSKMAKAIAADGEGATKLITISVNNAKTTEDADAVGKTLANSPLVKTAVNGNDANWGRIISAAGNSGASFDPEKVSICFNQMPIIRPNFKVVFDEAEAKEILSKDEVTISIDLSEGTQTSTWWTCDLSENYVRINSSYRS